MSKPVYEVVLVQTCRVVGMLRKLKKNNYIPLINFLMKRKEKSSDLVILHLFVYQQTIYKPTNQNDYTTISD